MTKLIISPPDIDFKPLAIRSCRVARSRMTKRDPTPDTSGDESNISVYAPSPKIRPVRYRQVKENSSEERSVSPPLVSIKTEPPSSPSSSSSSTRAVGSPKGKPKPKSKSMQKPKQGGGGGRKGEPRRTQNMIAQKKYRDKRVKAADLVCSIKSLHFCTVDRLTPRCPTLSSSFKSARTLLQKCPTRDAYQSSKM
jgi:hypothetical protein